MTGLVSITRLFVKITTHDICNTYMYVTYWDKMCHDNILGNQWGRIDIYVIRGVYSLRCDRQVQGWIQC